MYNKVYKYYFKKMADFLTEKTVVADNNSELFYIKPVALERAWEKGVSARHIEFKEIDDKKVWGVEYFIPLRFKAVEGIYKEIIMDLASNKGLEVSSEELENLANRNHGLTWHRSSKGFVIPENITALKIVDLAPQEVLPRKLRNLRGKKNIWHDKGMILKLTRQSVAPETLGAVEQLSYTDPAGERNEALDILFGDIFRWDKPSFRAFNEICSSSSGKEVVVIHSHGGYDTIIGEQEFEAKGPGAKFQVPGNRIDLNDVLAKYQDKSKYACILVSTCYLGPNNDLKSSVKGFRLYGFSGISGSPFEVFFPKKTLTFGGDD